ncbi:MAG: hypothetical protein M1834_009378 [Cirrosporium novae-zelandiae]|nr:MAG: hypothetical protein M1834_009378 [Cirrosporium novae-zelandiae]
MSSPKTTIGINSQNEEPEFQPYVSRSSDSQYKRSLTVQNCHKELGFRKPPPSPVHSEFKSSIRTYYQNSPDKTAFCKGRLVVFEKMVENFLRQYGERYWGSTNRSHLQSDAFIYPQQAQELKQVLWGIFVTKSRNHNDTNRRRINKKKASHDSSVLAPDSQTPTHNPQSPPQNLYIPAPAEVQHSDAQVSDSTSNGTSEPASDLHRYFSPHKRARVESISDQEDAEEEATPRKSPYLNKSDDNIQHHNITPKPSPCAHSGPSDVRKPSQGLVQLLTLDGEVLHNHSQQDPETQHQQRINYSQKVKQPDPEVPIPPIPSSDVIDLTILGDENPLKEEPSGPTNNRTPKPPPTITPYIIDPTSSRAPTPTTIPLTPYQLSQTKFSIEDPITATEDFAPIIVRLHKFKTYSTFFSDLETELQLSPPPHQHQHQHRYLSSISLTYGWNGKRLRLRRDNKDDWHEFVEGLLTGWEKRFEMLLLDGSRGRSPVCEIRVLLHWNQES